MLIVDGGKAIPVAIEFALAGLGWTCLFTDMALAAFLRDVDGARKEISNDTGN